MYLLNNMNQMQNQTPTNTVYVPHVIEREGNVERSQDIFSMMLNNRIIMVHSGVNDSMASIIIASLFHLEQQSDTAPIQMYINSPGGSIYAGTAIRDVMNFIKPEIVTIGMGICASMGSILLTSGTKGKRFLLPDARVMIHQASAGASGTVTQIEDSYKETRALNERMIDILTESSGKPREKVAQDCLRDFFMSGEEAVEYGLVDRIIKSREDVKL